MSHNVIGYIISNRTRKKHRVPDCKEYTVLRDIQAKMHLLHVIVHTKLLTEKTRYQQSTGSWKLTKEKLPVGYNL